MTISLTSSIHRERISFAGSMVGLDSVARGDQSSANPFERLIQLTRTNDRLMAELTAAQRRLDQAMTYAGDAGSGSRLGAALVAHACKKRTGLLNQLRSTRSEALELLASGGTPR